MAKDREQGEGQSNGVLWRHASSCLRQHPPSLTSLAGGLGGSGLGRSKGDRTQDVERPALSREH